MNSIESYPPFQLTGTDLLPALEMIVPIQSESNHLISNRERLEAGLKQICRQHGIVMLGHLTILDHRVHEAISFHERPNLRNYVADYQQLGLDQVDPVLNRCRREVLPVPWGINKQRTSARGGVRRLYSLLDDYGLKHGIGVPIHSHQGFSLLGMVVDDSENSFLKRLPSLAQLMVLLATSLHDAVLRLNLLGETHHVKLTDREAECLTLCSRGLSAAQIGDRINISQRTVTFHLQNVKRKLNTNNLTQSVVRALEYKLISP